MASIEPSTSWPWQNICDGSNNNYDNYPVCENQSSSVYADTGSVPVGGIADAGNGRGRSKTPATSMSLASEFDDIGISFTKLSIQEKESAFNDLHGCPEIIKECPEMVAGKMAELDAELRKRTGESNSTTTGKTRNTQPINSFTASSAYIQAYRQDKSYVEDWKFRLAFLRADMYQVKEAAERILVFFDQKLNLFGASKLTKPILYQDLSSDDLDCLHSGSLQLLPLKDRAGRSVIVAVNAHRREKTIENYLRAHFYFYMKLLETSDETLQTLGYVGVLYNLENRAWGILTGQRDVARLRFALPIRMSAAHLCYKNSALRVVFNVGISYLPSKLQHRMRLHFGSHTECSYALTGYGIPAHALPIVDGASNMLFNRKNGSEQLEYLYPIGGHLQMIQKMKEDDMTKGWQKENLTDLLDERMFESADDDIIVAEEVRYPLGSTEGMFDDDETWSDAMADGQGDSMVPRRNTDDGMSELPPPRPPIIGLSDGGGNLQTVVASSTSSSSSVMLQEATIAQTTMATTMAVPTMPAGNNQVVNPYSGFFFQLPIHSNEMLTGHRQQQQQHGGYEIRQYRGTPLNLPASTNSTIHHLPPAPPVGEFSKQIKQKKKKKKKIVLGCDGTLTELYVEDVLAGRGRPVNKFAGNLYYRQIILATVDTYEKANKQEKTQLAKSIVRKIKNRGGRFLKCLSSAQVTFHDFAMMLNDTIDDDADNNNDMNGMNNKNKYTNNSNGWSAGTVPVWQEINDTAARAKVAAAFRTIRNSSCTNNNKKT